MNHLKLPIPDLELLHAMPYDQLGRMIVHAVEYAKTDGAEEPDIAEADKLAWVTVRRMVDASIREAQQRSTAGKASGESRSAQKPKKTAKKVEKVENDNPKPKRFVKPTEEEVAAYVNEKGYSINPTAFMAFYDSKGWKIGDAPMKDWRAAVRTWAIRRSETPAPQQRPQKVLRDQQYEQRECVKDVGNDWMKEYGFIDDTGNPVVREPEPDAETVGD